MRAIYILALVITTSLIYSTPLVAQQIISDKGEVTRENKRLSKYHSFGTHNGKEIQVHVKGTTINIIENKKSIVKENVSYKTDEGKALVNELILKDNELVMLSLVTSTKSEGIYLQRLNYKDLSPIGAPIKISSLEEVAKSSIPSVFRSDVVSMNVFYNEKTENISIVVNATPNKKEANDFIEIITIDKNYKTVGSPYTFYASNAENEVLVSELESYDEGTVAAVILERDKKFVLGYTLTCIDLADDNIQESKALPALNRIEGLKLSNNIYDGKLNFTIFAVDSDEKTKGAITIYEYNTENHVVDNKTYGINESDLSKLDYSVALNNYDVYESQFLDDGSNILVLSNSYDVTSVRSDGSYKISYYEKGFLIIKIDKNKEVLWVSEVKRNAAASGYAAALKFLTYYTADGRLEIIFNTNEKQFENGTYNTNVRRKGVGLLVKKEQGFVPTKATVNLLDGHVSVKEMKFGNKEIRNITTDEVVKGDEPGVYTTKALLGKNTRLFKFDFK